MENECEIFSVINKKDRPILLCAFPINLLAQISSEIVVVVSLLPLCTHLCVHIKNRKGRLLHKDICTLYNTDG